MKRIIKKNPPPELQRWFRQQGGLNCSYDDMPTSLKDLVKERLIEEQGALCCYTGKRVDKNSSHIEHLKPQSASRVNSDNDDVTYKNMLAAFPKEPKTKNAPPCPYGAKPRENWYDLTLFVHPLLPNCEQRFVFNTNGEIAPRNADDEGAKETIRVLRLNHEYLNEDRKEAIHEFLYADEISEAQAKRLREKVMHRDYTGRFKHFCFVLAQACDEYIRRLEMRRARSVAIQRQQRS